MRATVVHYIDSDTFGGAERALGHLLAHHDRRRWRPLLFHHGAPGLAPLRAVAREQDIGERTLPALTGTLGGRRVPAFARALRRERPAVVHAHLTWALGCSWGLIAAAVARVQARIATVQLFRAGDDVRLPLVQRTIVPHLVDRYIAVSEHVRRELIDSLGMDGRRIVTIPNGVPCSSALAVEGERHALRERLFPGERRSIALSVARLDGQKALHQLIAAATKIDDVLFVIAGDGPLRPDLEAQAARMNVDERVRFLGQRTDVSSLLRAADMFVLPSLHEGLPLSVLEAARAGTPVIASRIGGTDEVITDGLHGLLFPAGDVPALVAAIERLKSDHALAHDLALAAAERVAAEFDASAVAARVESVYEDALRA